MSNKSIYPHHINRSLNLALNSARAWYQEAILFLAEDEELNEEAATALNVVVNLIQIRDLVMPEKQSWPTDEKGEPKVVDLQSYRASSSP